MLFFQLHITSTFLHEHTHKILDHTVSYRSERKTMEKIDLHLGFDQEEFGDTKGR